MIDLSVRLDIHDEPHRHYRGADLLSTQALADLNATASDPGRFERLDRSTGNVRRRYRLSVLPLLDEEQGITPDLDILAPPWRELVTDLLSDRFVEWIQSETGFDATGLRRTSAIFRHYDGDFQDLSTGKLHKKMHVELHLNEDWPLDGGGEWEFWSGPDRTVGPHSTMSPLGGTALLYSASESSWHQMAPVAEGRGLVRLRISLSFFA